METRREGKKEEGGGGNKGMKEASSDGVGDEHPSGDLAFWLSYNCPTECKAQRFDIANPQPNISER